MSMDAADWKQVLASPTNDSTAKSAYSFSKSERFRSPPPQQYSALFYQTTSTNNKRSTSFGYGNKYDFTRDQPSTPPSNTYNMPSQFKHNSKQKGYCFGQGRGEMVVTGPLAETLNNRNPGPGAYQPLKKTGKVAYSIKGKVKWPTPEAEKVPGPGTYKQNNLFDEKGAVQAKHVNHKAVDFASGGQRFKEIDSAMPGPGRYESRTIEFNSLGKYSLSSLHNSKVRSFGNSKRPPLNPRCESNSKLIQRLAQAVIERQANLGATREGDLKLRMFAL